MGSENGSSSTRSIRGRLLEFLERLGRSYDAIEGTVRTYGRYLVRTAEVILAIALLALLAHWIHWAYVAG